MTKKEYKEYQKRVEEFFSHGLQNLSTTCDEPFFSWSPCECCGKPEGGSRYSANGYNSEIKGIENFENICLDCIYYAEYGQLDDQTMMDIERDEQ